MKVVKVLGVVCGVLVAGSLYAAEKQKIRITAENLRLFLPVGKYACYVGSAVGESNLLGLLRPAREIQIGARFNPVAVGLSKKNLAAKAKQAGSPKRGVKRAYLECLSKSAADLPAANIPEVQPTPLPEPTLPGGDPSPTPVATPPVPEGFSSLLRLEVSNDRGFDSFEIGFYEGEWAPGKEGIERRWILPAERELVDANGQRIALLREASVTAHRGALYLQSVSLKLEAGSLPVLMRATTGELSFPELQPEGLRARVLGSFSLSELGGDGGMIIDPEPHGLTGMASVQYNAPAPDGLVLRNMVSSVGCSPGPCQASGWEGPYQLDFPSPVRSMSSQIRLILTAGDQVLAQANYKITPP